MAAGKLAALNFVRYHDLAHFSDRQAIFASA
jgi:hypothetical protein